MGREGNRDRTGGNGEGPGEGAPWHVAAVAAWVAALVVVAARVKEEGDAGASETMGATLAAEEVREEERILGWRDA